MLKPAIGGLHSVRLLLDNNILVSSLLSPTGPPAQLADAWREGRFELVTSREQLTRLAEVLARPKILNVIGTELANKLIADIEFVSEVVVPVPDINACGDPEDNLILGTALAGKVQLLVTGDKRHLLPLQLFEGIPILTAVEALARLAADSAHETPQD